MMTREDNELLTLVEGDAPMGQMIRHNHWLPALRAGRLEADGAPIRVRLLGSDYVAFRATDGRVGFLDEACPHRGASLALARNEDCALRCIFHGWKIHVTGKVMETPTECNDPEGFAAKVPVHHYPVHEAGGLLWVWLGEGEPARFPDLPFTRAEPQQLFVASTKIPVNWVQGLDATLDSAHIGFLHRDWMEKLGSRFAAASENFAPRYEFEPTPYGLRAAALRPLADGSTHVRIGETVMPFYTSTFASVAGEGSYQILVPIDNVNTLWIYVRWTTNAALQPEKLLLATPGADIDNWVPPLGDAETCWGQDRASMKTDSFSGFHRGLLDEDTVVQISMGPIVDRTKEFLTSADMAIVRARRMLMQAARDHAAGKVPHGARHDVDYGEIEASGGVIGPGEAWQQQFPQPGSRAKASAVAAE
jgi:phthalate 4,5-dioxygenase oxygenase subunit